MLARIFSRLLLPEPLRPTIPKNSPLRTSNETPLSACSSRCSIARQGMGHPLLERVDPLVGDPEHLVNSVRLDYDGGARARRGGAEGGRFQGFWDDG